MKLIHREQEGKKKRGDTNKIEKEMFSEEIQLSDKRQFLEWRKQPILAVT